MKRILLFSVIRKFTILNLLAILLLIHMPLKAKAEFDRVRIAVTTSSDWTILRLKGDERIATLVASLCRDHQITVGVTTSSALISPWRTLRQERVY